MFLFLKISPWNPQFFGLHIVNVYKAVEEPRRKKKAHSYQLASVKKEEVLSLPISKGEYVTYSLYYWIVRQQSENLGAFAVSVVMAGSGQCLLLNLF